MDILRTLRLRRTPQSEAADPRQVANSAGGYAFMLDDVARLHRFLTLGVDGGTYYSSTTPSRSTTPRCSLAWRPTIPKA